MHGPLYSTSTAHMSLPGMTRTTRCTVSDSHRPHVCASVGAVHSRLQMQAGGQTCPLTPRRLHLALLPGPCSATATPGAIPAATQTHLSQCRWGRRPTEMVTQQTACITRVSKLLSWRQACKAALPMAGVHTCTRYIMHDTYAGRGFATSLPYLRDVVLDDAVKDRVVVIALHAQLHEVATCLRACTHAPPRRPHCSWAACVFVWVCLDLPSPGSHSPPAVSLLPWAPP